MEWGRATAGRALVVVLLTCCPGVAVAQSDPGQTTTGTVTSNGTEYPYLLHTPASYRSGRPAPLLVMVHGCQTTAQQEMELTLYNRIAEREGFVVLYPEVDETGRQQPGPLNHCWKFFEPSAYFRGNSDPAAIAAMTWAVISTMAIDTERVYAVGVSAGGLMTAVLAAAYSELYAAVGNVASAGYADGTCFTTGVGTPVQASAQLAFEQMGPRARVVPIIAIGSTADQAFPASCTIKAVEQSLRTSNLVLSGGQEGPIALTPATVRDGKVPGGHPYTVGTFRDPAGCLIGERWIIDGMPHAWPGGTTDPKLKGYVDNRAPDGAEAAWAFLERYRKSDTAMPCAEAPITKCPARAVTITLPRGARVRSVRASVAGRPVPATRRGRRVTLTIPPGPSGSVRVVLRVRRQRGAPAQVVRRTFARCAAAGTA